jgi:hypothetical protein
MRKYLLPSLLVLALSAGLALAQTYSRAIQLSQDLTGAFLVDSNNGFYFPQHVLSTGPAPTLTGCGTGSPTIAGSDFAGTITGGTAATGCTVTFAKAYLTVPWCVVTGQTSPGTSPIAYSLATTSIIITYSVATGLKQNYLCSSAS